MRWAWLGPWAVLTFAPLIVRGPLPPDELRYLSVAWEMWSSGQWLVPQLGAEPYADKPPLMFWLMHTGWTLFGVNDWWPRLLPGLFALSGILLTRRICKALWPEQRLARDLVAWLLLGTLAWSLYTQVLLFDLLLSNLTLLGWLGLIRAQRGKHWSWLLVAGAIAGGLLTKGPVMLLHLAGPALLVAWWGRKAGAALLAWYGRLALALVAGSALALAWVVPAVVAGGLEYASQLLLYQTAGRLVESFSHARSLWYYVWVLPFMFLPWSVWPAGLVAARDMLRAALHDRGSRLVITATVPALVVFTIISGKQPHYLLPMMPLFTSLLAVGLERRAQSKVELRARAPVILTAIVALVCAFSPLVLSSGDLRVAPWSPVWGIAAAIVIVALGRAGTLTAVVPRLTLVVPILVLTTETAFFRANAAAYDLSPAAALVHELQQRGHPVALVGDYQGELHFLGRLTTPLQILNGPGAWTPAEWAAAHPGGYVVNTWREKPETAFYTQPLRGGWLTIQAASEIAAP